jgi:hypothetical protein
LQSPKPANPVGGYNSGPGGGGDGGGYGGGDGGYGGYGGGDGDGGADGADTPPKPANPVGTTVTVAHREPPEMTGVTLCLASLFLLGFMFGWIPLLVMGVYYYKNPIGSVSAPVGGNGTLASPGVAASGGGNGGRGNVNPVGMIIGGCIWGVCVVNAIVQAGESPPCPALTASQGNRLSVTNSVKRIGPD